MEEEVDYIAGFNDFVASEKKESDDISFYDTSTLDESDALDHKVKKAQTLKLIKTLNEQRGERDDEDIDLDIDIAMQPLKKMEKELTAAYKPVPDRVTNQVPPNGKEPETPTLDKFTAPFRAMNEFTDDMFEAIGEPFEPAAKLGLNLIKKANNALGGTFQSAWNALGGDMQLYDRLREATKEEGETLNKQIDPKGELLVKPTESMSIIASMIPIGVAPKETFAAIEAGLGYINEMSETGDVGEAIEAGGVAGAFSLVGAKIADKLFSGGKVPTKFAKEIKKLGKDDEAALNNVLDNLDANDLKRMDENARNTIMDNVMGGKMSTEEIAANLKVMLQKQSDESKKAVGAAYDEANKLARDTEILPTTKVAFNARQKSTKTIQEKKATKEIDTLLKKKHMNAEDMETVLSDLKGLQRSAKGKGKNVYGNAIEDLQKMQDELGGATIYKEARELSKQHKVDFEGSIAGAGAKAGKRVGGVLTDDDSFNIGQQLVGKNIDPNNIGKAVEGLSEGNKMQVVQDLLSKDVGDITTPDGVIKFVSNFNKIDPKGLEILVGKKAADKIKLNVDTIATMESSILSANKVDTGVAQEILDIATAASMVHLSPFLAAKSTVHGVKKIIGKKMTAAQRNALLQRTKTITDKPLRRKLTKAITVLTIPNGLEDAQEVTQATQAVDTTIEDKPITEKSKPSQASDIDAFNKMFPKATSVDTTPKESTVVYGKGAKEYSGTRPSGVSRGGSTKPIPKNAPRNVQNNNLGNIKHNPSNDWKGQTSEKGDKTFVSFKTPEHGVRALKRVINANIKATNSIETYVNRYASEPKEKAYFKQHGKLMPHLQNYAKTIASSQGIKNIKSMPKNVNMKRWIKATAIAEGGGKALKYFTDSVIERGINMS